MRRYVGFAFLLVALLTLIVWIISQFIQPLLPDNIGGGVVLFFVALLSVVGFLAAFKDTIELLHFFSGNSEIIAENPTSHSKAVYEASLLLYPYDNPPYNSVELHYVGQEQAMDLQVWKIFLDKDGVEQRILVNQFFSKDDLRMSWYHVPANVMTENDLIRFHLVQKQNTLDGKAMVEVKFVGAKTCKVVEIRKEFNLVR